MTNQTLQPDRPEQTSNSLLGVVLCGGRSRRMGRDKASLTLPGVGTFADHAVQRLKGLCERVCVAGDSPAVLNVEVLQDPTPFRGPVVGIAMALAFADQHGYDACLVTPVDVPDLNANDLATLIRAWEQHGTLCCAISEDDGYLQPLIAVYPTSMRDHLKQLAASENRSLMRWITTQNPKLVRLSAQSCRNVNAPEDLDI